MTPMRLALLTSIVSPHQVPLAQALAARLEANSFLYVATENIGAGRTALGWRATSRPSWIMTPADGRSGMSAEVRRRLAEADVILSGNRDCDLFRTRLAARRLTLYCSERWFKPPLGRLRLAWPPYLLMAWRLRHLSRNPHLHYLAIGGWAAGDMRAAGRVGDRIWQWAYFVNASDPLPAPRQRQQHDALRILWAGRMLGWKRNATLIDAVASLCRAGCRVSATLIGEGPEKTRLRRQVERLGLDKVVSFHGPMPIAEVRQHMRAADIYVLSSSGYEGWGTVVNEAMLEGCAVVAAEETGAARTLIRNGYNGFLFRSGRTAELAERLARLGNDESLRQRVAAAGQRSMLAEWTPDVAADRLVTMIETLAAGRRFDGYASGPLMRMRR